MLDHKNNGEPANIKKDFSHPKTAIIQTESMPKVWGKVDFKNKMKLRAGYTAGVLSSAIIKDLVKHKWLNLAFVGVSLIPGPGGVLFFPALLISYTARWDEHAKQTRRKLWNLIKHDVPLAKYQPIIKPDPKKQGFYYVDTKKLLKLKFGIIKNGALKIKNTALTNFPSLYDKYISVPFQKSCDFFKPGLSRVIGIKKSENTIKSIFNTKSAIENTIGKSIIWINDKVDCVTSWTALKLSSLFNNTSKNSPTDTEIPIDSLHKTGRHQINNTPQP